MSESYTAAEWVAEANRIAGFLRGGFPESLKEGEVAAMASVAAQCAIAQAIIELTAAIERRP